jgi:hypothetical protein
MTEEEDSLINWLVAGLAVTPSDLMDALEAYAGNFPVGNARRLDDPDKFFQYVDESMRVTLNQTKRYETHFEEASRIFVSAPVSSLRELREGAAPPPLKSQARRERCSTVLVTQLKIGLLPAVAFQLNTYGHSSMFRTLPPASGWAGDRV